MNLAQCYVGDVVEQKLGLHKGQRSFRLKVKRITNNSIQFVTLGTNGARGNGRVFTFSHDQSAVMFALVT